MPSETMRTKKKTTSGAVHRDAAPKSQENSQQLCLEGESFNTLLKSIQREIELATAGDTSLSHKFWIKQQFSVGVNEVTRVLERMPQDRGNLASCDEQCDDRKIDCVRLQAILLACDCNPRSMIKHLPSLAASRNVPIILVKGDIRSRNNNNNNNNNKGGSGRLGELVKLRTAISIGIKDKGSSVNHVIKEFIADNRIMPEA